MVDKNLKTMLDIISWMNEEHGEITGPLKVSALRSAANYYENLTQAEAQLNLMKRAFDIMN